jgi:hypothetical protein
MVVLDIDKARETVKVAVGMGEFIDFIHDAGTSHPGPLKSPLYTSFPICPSVLWPRAPMMPQPGR